MVIRWPIYEGGFHFHVERCARRNGLKGWLKVVKQPMYEYVEVEVEGRRRKIDRFLADLQQVPGRAKPMGVELQWKTYKGNYPDFKVRF